MIATVLDLRRRMKDILRALDRNESVTIMYRGRKKAVLKPASERARKPRHMAEHPAFGIWKDREDMRDVHEWLRKSRERHHRAV